MAVLSYYLAPPLLLAALYRPLSSLLIQQVLYSVFLFIMASMKMTELLVPYAGVGDTYAISILLPALGICLVGLRVYTRVLQKWAFGIDDWLILPALVCKGPQFQSLWIILRGIHIDLRDWHGHNTHCRFV